jgi:hypothetical protein
VGVAAGTVATGGTLLGVDVALTGGGVATGIAAGSTAASTTTNAGAIITVISVNVAPVAPAIMQYAGQR